MTLFNYQAITWTNTDLFSSVSSGTKLQRHFTKKHSDFRSRKCIYKHRLQSVGQFGPTSMLIVDNTGCLDHGACPNDPLRDNQHICVIQARCLFPHVNAAANTGWCCPQYTNWQPLSAGISACQREQTNTKNRWGIPQGSSEPPPYWNHRFLEFLVHSVPSICFCITVC